jgi:pimeloyl-ACP methyl ester carboxylesterase
MSPYPLLASISALPKTLPIAGPRILAIHGLFGSKQNWRSTIDTLAQKTGLVADAIDLRNHGSSFHNEITGVVSMADDVLAWCLNQKAGADNKPSIIPIGHSLGGKVVMQLLKGLTSNDPRLSGVSIPMAIILDISPVPADPKNQYLKNANELVYAYASSMAKIQDMRLNDRKEIDRLLSDAVKDDATRYFLLANLTWNDPNSHDYLKFRFNTTALHRGLQELMEWKPVYPSNIPIPILFIIGTKSPYFPKKEWSEISSIFPKAEFVSIPSGHWPHVEQPDLTMSAIASFIEKHRSDSRPL